MKKIIFSFLGALLLLACGKDKFKSEPQVEIRSFGPNTVVNKSMIRLSAVVRDKEGDLQDSVLLVSKRYNNNTLLTVDTLPFTLQNMGFPDRQEIELEVAYSYGELVEGAIFQNLETADRNFAVGIIVKDKAGNRSAYVETDKIVLKKF